jgi:tetraacyldisaccharide 4'-kinase
MPDRVTKTRTLLLPLSWIWRAGTVVNQARRRASRKALQTPVISIGALTMGGAGKTPMVAHLARRLRDMGKNPAILTRGYKRVSMEPIVIVPRGGSAKVELTGDEAQILVRRGDAHVGIGANRYEVGRRMEKELAPDVFLLDDGFQHVQLHRDHDVVLIDADDPEAGGLFPAGRLREPMSALQRATEVVITRGDRGIAGVLAPMFRSRVVPMEWANGEPGVAVAAAFCGLGDPRSFWRTLEEQRVNAKIRIAFADHHTYSVDDLKHLAKAARDAGAETLVTTEKDAMNLCAKAEAIVAPLKLSWLKIGIEIDGEDELLKRLTGATA